MPFQKQGGTTAPTPVFGGNSVIARQLRMSGKVNMLDKVMTHARLLMTIDHEPVAAVVNEKPNETQLLREQLTALTEQVATLTTKASQPPRSRPRCFNCNQIGHLQHDCRRQ